MQITADGAVLTLLIFLIAIMYSSAGHGGASGYLAAMALAGVAPAVMKPSALFLNILVSATALIGFSRAGAFEWRVFWPFAAASVPLAFIGGMTPLSGAIYKKIVGAVLLFSAYQLLSSLRGAVERPKPPALPAALAAGGSIGLLSGLTGVGGGIFLSPLLILKGWADPRHTAGVSAAFILVNSISGLLGYRAMGGDIPESIWAWAAAALAGGLIGAGVGSRKLSNTQLRRALGAVLLIAGFKFLFLSG